jgi:hypothetical protein
LNLKNVRCKSFEDVIERLESGFSTLPPVESKTDEAAMCAVMNEEAERLHDN